MNRPGPTPPPPPPPPAPGHAGSGLPRVAPRTAAEVAAKAPLGDEARALLKPGLNPKQFLDALAAAGLHLDALRFLAFALPKREAVWWACQCCRSAAGPAPAPPPAQAALQAAERWAAEPKEENRRAAWAAAEPAGLGTPAGCCAAGAFWSGGSLAPANLPAVPPADDLTPRSVVNAVTLAAVVVEPEKAPERHKQFLAIGLEVASGTNRWKEATAARR